MSFIRRNIGLPALANFVNSPLAQISRWSKEDPTTKLLDNRILGISPLAIIVGATPQEYQLWLDSSSVTQADVAASINILIGGDAQINRSTDMPAWHQYRPIFQKAFKGVATSFKTDTLPAIYEDLRIGKTDTQHQLQRHISEYVNKHYLGEHFALDDMHLNMSQTTEMLNFVFAYHFANQMGPFKTLVPGYKKSMALSETVRNRINNVLLKLHEADIPQEDFGVLFAVFYEQIKRGNRTDLDAIIGETAGMFIALLDTIPTAMTGILYVLSRLQQHDPQFLERLDDVRTKNAVRQMGTALFPPALMMARKTTQLIDFAGTTINPSTDAIVSIFHVIRTYLINQGFVIDYGIQSIDYPALYQQFIDNPKAGNQAYMMAFGGNSKEHTIRSYCSGVQAASRTLTMFLDEFPRDVKLIVQHAPTSPTSRQTFKWGEMSVKLQKNSP